MSYDAYAEVAAISNLQAELRAVRTDTAAAKVLAQAAEMAATHKENPKAAAEDTAAAVAALEHKLDQADAQVLCANRRELYLCSLCTIAAAYQPLASPDRSLTWF